MYQSISIVKLSKVLVDSSAIVGCQNNVTDKLQEVVFSTRVAGRCVHPGHASCDENERAKDPNTGER